MLVLIEKAVLALPVSIGLIEHKRAKKHTCESDAEAKRNRQQLDYTKMRAIKWVIVETKTGALRGTTRTAKGVAHAHSGYAEINQDIKHLENRNGQKCDA